MKRNVARMRYQVDKRSSGLCLMAIVFNVVYFLCLYSNNSLSPDFQMGLDVLCNILFLLFAFLASEKAKTYSKSWARYMILGGAVQILRILWVPAHFLNTGALTQGSWLWLAAGLGLSAACLILAGVSSYANSAALENFLRSEKEN